MDTPREIAQENYIMDHIGQCGTCHYWHNEGKGHSCMNFDSPFAADWCDEDEGCDHWIAKRNIHY